MLLKNNFLLVTIFVGLVIVFNSIAIVPAGQTGVVFNKSGGIQKDALNEGLHFLIPFVQELIIFDTRIKTYSFTSNRFGDVPFADPIDAKTMDGQDVNLELTLIAQIKSEKAPEIYDQVRSDVSRLVQTKTISATQKIIASHYAADLYTDEARTEITKKLIAYMRESLLQNGTHMILHDVLLRRIEFSDEYFSAIENKQLAFQNAEIAGIEANIAKKDKMITEIKGNAIAKDIEIKGRALSNPKIAEFEFLKEIEKTERPLPVFVGAKNTFINLADFVSQQRGVPAN